MLKALHLRGRSGLGRYLQARSPQARARAMRRTARPTAARALAPRRLATRGRCEGRAARRQAGCTARRLEAGALGRSALLRLREPRHFGLGHLHAASASRPAAEAEIALELRRAVAEDAVRILPRPEGDACLTRADRGDGERAARASGGEDELVYLLRAEEDVRLDDQPYLDAWGGSLGCRGRQPWMQGAAALDTSGCSLGCMRLQPGCTGLQPLKACGSSMGNTSGFAVPAPPGARSAAWAA